MSARLVRRWELEGVEGAVVAIDVIRALTTAAYAFDAGAAEIYLVSGVDEALAFKASHPKSLAMGENHGRRPEGFDFPNSPAAVSRADLTDRILVQRTSAGTQGVLAAHDASRLWASSLACASATAAAVNASGLGEPACVITGCFEDDPTRTGDDDALTAEFIERVRLGLPADSEAASAELLATREASRTLLLGPEHCDPIDIELAATVDAFDFAMEAERMDDGLRLTTRRP